MNNLEKLKEKIVELVPEIIDKEFINLPIARDIKLEDVLVALKDKVTNTQEYEIERGLAIFFVETEPLESEPFKWHLNKPLHEQEKECIEFLYKLLVTDK